jgi:hypothetical protein
MMSNGDIAADASAGFVFWTACCSVEPDLDQMKLPTTINMRAARRITAFVTVFAPDNIGLSPFAACATPFRTVGRIDAHGKSAGSTGV